jgi:hypothetical protein
MGGKGLAELSLRKGPHGVNLAEGARRVKLVEGAHRVRIVEEGPWRRVCGMESNWFADRGLRRNREVNRV